MRVLLGVGLWCASVTAQEWPKLDALCAKIKAAGAPMFVTVVGEEGESFASLSGELPSASEDGPTMLPLGHVSRVALACLLDGVAQQQKIAFDEPIVTAGVPAFAGLGEPFTRWTWRQVLDRAAWGGVDAWRFLGPGEIARPMAEFIRAHGIPDEEWVGLEGRRWVEHSQLPFALLQAALEARTQHGFARWVRDASLVAKVPGVRVLSAPVTSSRDAEVDASFDLALTPPDAVDLLRWLLGWSRKGGVPGSDIAMHGAAPDDPEQQMTTFVSSSSWDGGSCLIQTAVDGSSALFAWLAADAPVDAFEVGRAFLDDSTKCPVGKGVSMGFVSGYGKLNAKLTAVLSGFHRASFTDLVGTTELRLIRDDDRVFLQVMPDGPRVRVRPRGDMLAAEFKTVNLTPARLWVRLVDDQWQGVVTTIDHDHSILPWRIRFERVER